MDTLHIRTPICEFFLSANQMSIFDLVGILQDTLRGDFGSNRIRFREEGISLEDCPYAPPTFSFAANLLPTFLDLSRPEYNVSQFVDEVRRFFPGVSFQELELVVNAGYYSIYRV